MREKLAEGETTKPSDNSSEPTTAIGTDSSSSTPSTDASVSDNVTTNPESTEESTEKKGGIEWWMIALPIVALAIGVGSALIIIKCKKKKDI